MLNRILFWAGVVIFAFYAFTNPHGAAVLVAAPFHLLAHAGTSLANFVNSL